MSIQPSQKYETIGPPIELEHYHNKYKGDCWDRCLRRLPPDPEDLRIRLALALRMQQLPTK